MTPLAQRILDLRASSHRPALGKASPGSIHLEVGEPDFPTPQRISDAAKAAIDQGHTGYTDQQGLAELRQAILESLPTAPATTHWNKDNILVTHGATSGIAAAFFTLISPGDKVVIPHPAYSLYADLVTLAGGEVIYAKLADDFHWDFDELARTMTGAKAIVFSNPSNPNGVIHTEDELRQLAHLAAENDTLVISDEAYSSLAFTGHHHTSALEIPELKGRILYAQTFSKKYAMTGWRIGYIAGDTELIDAIYQFHRTFNGPINNPTQRAALEALRISDEELEPMRAEYGARRDIVVQALSTIPTINLVQPEGAFYAFFSYPGNKPSEQVAAELTTAGVITRAGTEYGPAGEGHIRISFAGSRTNLEQGLKIIQNYFNNQN